jgi:hypothetical protein
VTQEVKDFFSTYSDFVAKVTSEPSMDLEAFEVISENQKKLEARYGEKFKIERSEVRKEGDL